MCVTNSSKRTATSRGGIPPAEPCQKAQVGAEDGR